MQAVDEEAWQPGGGAPAQRPRDAEDDGRREEDERDRAGAAAQVPERARRRPRRSCRVPRPRADVHDGARSGSTSRAGRPSDSSHAGASAPRTIAAVLAVFASTHDAAVDAHGAPGRRGRLAGRRVDDVMDGAPAPAPAADAGARRRQRAAATARSRWPRRAGPGAVVVGDVDRPAAGWDRSGGRDVATEADQRRRPRRRRDGGRGAVGREGLRRRAEVEAAFRGRAAAGGAARRASRSASRPPGRPRTAPPRRRAPPRSRGRSRARPAPTRRSGRRRRRSARRPAAPRRPRPRTAG